MALKQSLQQRLLQKLSPQQIQLMKMLQLPTIELEKRIKEELEINPALDEGEEQISEDEFTKSLMIKETILISKITLMMILQVTRHSQITLAKLRKNTKNLCLLATHFQKDLKSKLI